MSSIFGGSKQQSKSTNQAYPQLQQQLGGTINQGGQAGSAIANMLGLNGSPAQSQGFDQFRNSTGYQFGMDQGIQAITGGAASKGLLNSGATAKGLQSFGQNYASSKYGDYMSQLSNLLGMGNQSAGILANAGQQSSSSGSSNNGAGGFIGSLMGK